MWRAAATHAAEGGGGGARGFRARGSGALTSAIESIGPSKRRRIVQATRYLMLRHREWHAAPIRFDVVAFDGIDGAAPEIRWIRNAFDGS